MAKNPNAQDESCPAGLFDRIICAIKKEQELRQTRRLLCVFASLFGVSIILMPFSLGFFIRECNESGFFYFLSSATGNFNIALAYWKEFAMSIFEVLPIAAVVALAANTTIALFAIKLFFHRNGLLLKYLKVNLLLRYGP